MYNNFSLFFNPLLIETFFFNNFEKNLITSLLASLSTGFPWMLTRNNLRSSSHPMISVLELFGLTKIFR